ncbi:hypothetical protein NNA36_06815 [Shimia sp. CNT1-13L.2]|uniref:hypothetical protein n=1 Tax=Shimia sp. CNT1-13L.2 TaxID=2959663 RepID=UPI0020CC7178|nr:hypothetical protein [Shimia sp. CNT1-13L.2]MCP9481672.1 hypothetical protein [Shimia sp. CNT1-13L.2]
MSNTWKNPKSRRPEPYDPLVKNYQRLMQTSFLLTADKMGSKSRAQAAIMAHSLIWYPYRQQCGKIGEWSFATHETLAKKNAITVRQSQDAVAALKRHERIETNQRKVKGVKTLHMRPSGATLKLVNMLGYAWKHYGSSLQSVWDEAMNLDLLNSSDPRNLTLHHLVKEWDKGEQGMTLLLPMVQEIWTASKGRLARNQVPAHGDLPATKSPLTGTPVSPSTVVSYTETEKETESSEAEPGIAGLDGKDLKRNSVLGKKRKKKPSYSLHADLPPQFENYQAYLEHLYPDLSPQQHAAMFLKDYPDLPLSAFNDFEVSA